MSLVSGDSFEIISKLGKYEDIDHDSLEALQGDGFGEYGSVALFMVRSLAE